MVNLQTKLTGNLDGALDGFLRQVQGPVVLSGVAAMANVIYEQARENAPVLSGTLRDSMYRVFSKERSSDVVKTYRISWNRSKAPHGHLVEFGTASSPADPFLRPAFDRITYAIDVGRTRMSEKLGELKATS